MENLFSIASLAQVLCGILFLVHRFFKPLGSDFMLAILFASFIISLYLLWQVFVKKTIFGTQKLIAITLGILPFAWLALLIFFIGNSKM